MSKKIPDELNPKQEDARQDLRAPLILKKIKCEDGSKSFFGYAKNLSRGGLFISTVNPRAVGELFLVEMPLPQPARGSIQVTCEVLWKRDYEKKTPQEPGMGLRFVDLPEDAGRIIDEWVKSQLEAGEKTGQNRAK